MAWEEYSGPQENGEASLRFDPELRFHTELFGFDRVEVLSYIERISAANAEKARALEDTIAALQQDLTGARQRGGVLEQKAGKVFSELEFQKKRAEDAVAEAAALRTEMDKANDEIAAVRSRLFAQEQENETLRGDNSRLSETVDELTRTLEQRGVAQPAWRVEAEPPMEGESEKQLLQQAQLKARGILRAADEKAQAHIERAKQDAAAIVVKAKRESDASRAHPGESAGGIAASIALLKEQLAAVDAKILAAASDLQKATEGIAAALGDSGQSLSAPNAQTNAFPAAAPAAQPPAPAAQTEPYDRLRREEDAYYSALRRVQMEDALREHIYGQELRRARADAAQETEAASAYRAREEKKPAAPLLPQTPQTPDAEREAARPRYRETNGQPIARRPAPARGNGAPPISPEQYDAAQYENRVGAYREIPEVPPQPVVQKVEIPQVPAAKEPDPEAGVIFGKPHAPRAMPFAPFDPYTPHTAPYIEPEAEAARILNTPPPPPPRGTEARRPYIPQPTPIAPSAPLSEPYVQPSAMVLAGMPQARPEEARPAEPVIIPYSMPIPARGAPGPDDGAAVPPQRSGRASTVVFGAQQTGAPTASGNQEQPSALSDDLLTHLNRILNGKEP